MLSKLQLHLGFYGKIWKSYSWEKVQIYSNIIKQKSLIFHSLTSTKDFQYTGKASRPQKNRKIRSFIKRFFIFIFFIFEVHF